MTPTAILTLSVLLVSFPTGQVAPKDDKQDTQQVAADTTSEDQSSESRREERRRRFRARRDEYRSASPDQRREMQVERWAGMTSRTYDLNEEQEAQVRQEIRTMSEERRMAMGTAAVEYDQLRDKMFDRWSQGMEEAKDGESRRARFRRLQDDPELKKLREQMEKIEQAYPFDMEASIARIEKLLPEDQVRIGRERRKEWEKRRAEFRRDRDQRRENRQKRENNGKDEPVKVSSKNTTIEDAAKLAEDELSKAKAAAEAEQQRLLADQVKAAETAAEARSNREIHPWEQYTREFIQQHSLSETQSISALAILKSLRHQALQVETANAGKLAEAQKISDDKAREAELRALQQPIDDLFGELQQRLNSLLTTSQRLPDAS